MKLIISLQLYHKEPALELNTGGSLALIEFYFYDISIH